MYPSPSTKLSRYFAPFLACWFLAGEFFSAAEAQTWQTNNPLQAARWAHTATLLTNGTVLIAGGTIYNTNGNFADTNSCEIFVPQSGFSTNTGFMQTSRNGHRAILLDNGQVLVSGGGGDSSSEIYDPGSSSWIDYNNAMNYEREVHVMIRLPNGKILAAGGYDENTGQDLSSAEIYDPVAGTWTNTGNMPYPADTFAGVLLTNNTVLVCGGSDASQGIYEETNAAIYNPATGTWTNTAGMNEPRAGHTASLLPNGKVLVEGGTGDSTTEIYDPVAATWTYGPDMNDGRTYSDAVTLTNHQVMVSGDDKPDVELYDPVANSWTLTDSLPIPGYSQAMTLLAGGQVLVTGGDGTQYNGPGLAVTETYGGSTTVPTLTVTAAPQSGAPPLSVTFNSPATDSSGNTVTNWYWNFGDGSSNTLQNPTHVYSATGTFSPVLTAYSTYGSTPLSVIGPGTITVASPTLTASASPQSGSVSLTVQFSTPGTDSDGYSVTNWSWSFGDGGVSSAQSPGHTYTAAGQYAPSLVARSTSGSLPVTIVYQFGLITVTNLPNPAFRTIYSFSARSENSQSTLTNADGSGPNGGLIFVGSNLYGTTQHGGSSGEGTMFVVHPDGSGFTNPYTFTLNNGSIPPGGFTAAGTNLFGTTSVGGNAGGGTVYSVSDAGGSYSNLLSFSLNNVPSLGEEPGAGVSLSGNYLYCSTIYGGAYNHGTVTFVTTNGSANGILHNFTIPYGANDNLNSDGLYPFGKPIFSGGYVYGTAEQGGYYGYGVAYSVSTNSPYLFAPLHYFTAPDSVTGTNTDGAFPFSDLALSGNTLYGTAYGGGLNTNGTIFAVTIDGSSFTNLYNFKGGNDGSGPQQGMLLVGSSLYGTTPAGGVYANGTLFSIHTDGSHYAVLYNFTGGDDGGSPVGDLMISSNVLYGTCSTGGTTGNGTLFSYVLPVQLNIALAGTNVVLTWPAYAAGYSLESTLKLQTGAVWNAVSPLPSVVNGFNTVTNPASPSAKFYRLSQ